MAQQLAQLTRSKEEIKVVHARMEADAETDADAEADTGTDIMEENAALMEQDADAMEENVEAEAKGSEDPQSFQCVQCNAT